MTSIGQNKASISILYVEDEQETRETLLSMLAPRFPEQCFLTADNGLKGVELFRKRPTDIVITDITMPEMDGITMASMIKSMAPETIIIALTAHSETQQLMRAIEIGISHYVMKPIHYDRICSVIEQSISSIRKEQQLRDQYEQISDLNTALSARTEELEFLNMELEAFNYTVAHDLRSPLVSIACFSQSLLDQITEDVDQRSNKYLQLIYSETMRMHNLIESLLNFSRYTRKSVAKQLTNLSSIAYGIKADLQQREPQRQVSFIIGDGIKAFGDPILLNVVLENLLGNAWKYSAHNDAACIEFGVSNMADELVYYVRDNGIGFEPEEAANIFVPFQRLQPEGAFEGFGIGLATAGRIIQRHGGRIWAEGEKGRGATIFFSL